MKQYIPKTFRQIFALLLCAAMLMPMIPASVSAAAAAVDVLISVSDPVTEAALEVTSVNHRFDAVGTGKLKTQTPYAIMHVDTGYVMSYEAVAATPGTPNQAGSIARVDRDQVESQNTPDFYHTQEDNNYKIYIDHSMRSKVIWRIFQYATSVKQELLTNTSTTIGSTTYSHYAALYGDKSYGHTWLVKGTVSDAEYWTAVRGEDTNDPATQYRFMNPRYPNNWLTTTEPEKNTDETKRRYVIEDMGDGTFMVGWRSAQGTLLEYLTCDENGIWSVVEYKGDAIPQEGSAVLNKHKLKFLEYKEFSEKKTIQFTGSKIFCVTEDATYGQVLSYIQQNIKLADTGRLNTVVPCSGATPKIGYYYLKFDNTYPSSRYDQYTVSVLFRNDDNTDSLITTLTVNVQKRNLEFAGVTTYYVDEGVTKDAVCAKIAEKITVTNTLRNATGLLSSETVSYSATPVAGKYWLEFDSAFDSSANGDHDYFVNVNYRGFDGSDVLVKTLGVYVNKVINTLLEPESETGLVMVNSTLGAIVKDKETGHNVTITVDGVQIPLSVGMLTKDGRPVDTSVAGTYDGLMLTYGTKVISTNFILEVSNGDEVLDYPAEGEPGYVGVDKAGTTTEDEFSQNGVANIQLSATGIPVERGVDMIVVMDLSDSMLNSLDTNYDAPTYEQSRMAAMEQSLKEMVKTLQASGANVRIAMSDFGDLDHYLLDGAVIDRSIEGKSLFDVNFNNGKYAGYAEFANHLNYVFCPEGYSGDDVYDNPFGIHHAKFDLAEPRYTGLVIPTVYTGSGKVDAKAFVEVDKLYNGTEFTADMDSIITNLRANVNVGIGTNYDVGLEYAYYLGHAIQQDNIAKGVDRDVVCVFMSDGAPMQYNYFTGGSSSSAWVDWISGNITSLGTAGYTVSNPPAGLDTIEAELLAMLKAGTLVRPEYQRDTWIGYLYPTETAAQNKDTSGVYRAHTKAEGYCLYRMRYHTESDQFFYDYMARQGYDLDWTYLCDFAYANGIVDFDYDYYKANKNLPALLSLLTDQTVVAGYERVENKDGSVSVYPVYRSKLKNPSLAEAECYKPCTNYTGNDFFEAMKSIGIECTWDLFAKIAYKNCESLTGASTNKDEDAKVLRDLMIRMRTVPAGYSHGTVSPYTYFYNAEGKNWWAEAIKGDTDKIYPVINKYAQKDSTIQPYTYYGDVRDNYNGQKHMAGYRGLGMDMYTVSFSVADDKLILSGIAEGVLQKISSNSGSTGNYFFSASSQDELTGALKSIASTMSAGATGAYYTDTMGDDYDLYTGQVEGVDEVPTIKVLEYNLNSDGERTALINTRETITFAEKNGVIEAYSDQIFTTTTNTDGSIEKVYPNIWDRETGLIQGKYVIYNTNTTGTVDLYLDNSGRKFPLQAETFFWSIGKLGETEMVLEYQVYLTGSCDNSKTLPFARQYYDTNEEAKLSYINYLGNSCWLLAKTPAYPWGGGATEDVIVVDFGVPVKIDVLTNDTQFPNASVAGITKGYEPTSAAGSLTGLKDGNGNAVQFVDEVSGKFGTIVRSGNELTYTPNTMQFNGVEEFTYALLHTDGKYYFGKIKILPATTIYYEEDFVTYQSHNRADGSVIDTSVWSDSGSQVNTTQEQDRPGEDVNNALGSLDADNVYGYDGAYTEFSAFSQGQAKIASVDANSYGTATFSFYGTGFDIISMTNKTTGTVVLSVYDYDAYAAYLADPTVGKPTSRKDVIVDTYYGYMYQDGEWVVDKNESDTLYQVPVIKVSGLGYGRYTAVLTVAYHQFFDHGQYGTDSDGNAVKKYDFYLDSIRIYDPADDGSSNSVIKDAYVKDEEGWPEYFELRNLLISKNDFDSINDSTADSVPGVIFIDGFSALQDSDGNHTNIEGTGNLAGKAAAIVDYANFGPNNELYLAANQAVAFQLSVPGTTTAKVASIQIALKGVTGSVFVKVYDADDENTANVISGVPAGGSKEIATATDLYYDITALNNKTVVIMNTGETGGILSITNIKVTYTAEPEDGIDESYFKTTKLMATNVLRSINTLLASEGEQDPGEVVNGTIDLSSATLSFEDEILTNLYFTVTDVDSTEMGLLTWSAMPENATVDNAEKVFAGAIYDEVNDRYMVSTDGIAAKKLGDDIYMRVYAKTADGIVYSDVVTYSPKQYALSRLEKSDSEAMKALCVAMLNYGAAAQEYFGYKTDDLMNAALTDEQKALVVAYDSTLFKGAIAADSSKTVNFAKTSTGFSARSATVSFEGAFAINYYFAPDAEVAGDITFYYWTAEAYANAEVLTAENASGTAAMVAAGDGSYWAQVSGIAAKDLDETCYVAAVYTDAEGNTYCTGVIAYSVSKYCMNHANSNMGALAQATAMYGSYAKLYFTT